METQETERRRIARELHDEIGQILTGLNLTLDVLTQRQAKILGGSPDEARILVTDLPMMTPPSGGNRRSSTTKMHFLREPYSLDSGD